MDKLGTMKFLAGIVVGMAIANILLCIAFDQPQMWALHLGVAAFAVWVFWGMPGLSYK